VRRSLGLGAVVALSVFGLSACSGQASGRALAEQACVHVHRSVQEFVESTRAGEPAASVTSLQMAAAAQLHAALPLAADATSDDGSWNSLMTTISEISTIDEAHLVPSLKAQCQLADANQNVNPDPSGTTPENVNPSTG
jgi:hypothetical protein